MNDLRKDCRPNTLLKEQLETEFFTNIPVTDEGQTLNNKDAGITISHINKELLL